MTRITHSLKLTSLALLFGACGDRILPDLNQGGTTEPTLQSVIDPSDIILVAGGNTTRSTSPFPSHTIASFDQSTGVRKELLYTADSTEYLWGARVNTEKNKLVFTLDGSSDYLAALEPVTLSKGVFLISALLSGTTMRALAKLSDDSWLIAEATNSVEKFDSSLTNVSANGFRITTGLTQASRIRPISGDRFMIFQPAHTDDRPRVYANANAAGPTSVGLGLSCVNNCDIQDGVELPNGNFIFSVTNAAYNSLLITNSAFAVIGQFFKDELNLPGPGIMALLDNNYLLVCTTLNGNCERILINGNTGTLASPSPFIFHPVYSRNVTDIEVIPEDFNGDQ